MSKLTHLTRSSFILIAAFGLDKVVAFVRTSIIARQFSLSHELDAFNVANNLPDLLFALISGGAMTMALIPVLSEVMTQKGRPAVWDVFSRVANLAFVVTGAFAILIAIFAEPLVSARLGIAPGYEQVQRELIADLMRLNLFATLIFSISGLVMGGLQANQHFLLPALAPLFYNLGQIIGALVFSPTEPYTIGPITLPAFGMGVHGLVYGVILGAALHLGIQVPGLVKYKFRWTASLKLDQALVKVLKLIAPRLVTMFAIQLIFIVRDNLASQLDLVGAASILTYGWMIFQVPETLVGTAIATALLPTLSEQAAQEKWDEFRATVEKGVRVLVAFSLPVAAVIAAGIRPLAAAVFGFDETGTLMLAWTTRVFLLGMAGHTVLEVGVRAFYAKQDALRPMVASILNTAAFVLFGLLVIRERPEWGTTGIALVGMAYTAEAIFVMWWLNRRLEGPSITAGSSIVRGTLAALAGGAAAYALALYLPGGAVVTSLTGMTLGGMLSLAFILPEVRTLLRL
ncbi:MAG: murein biosynthesis integral membrane protein MurJ [Chloroflexota bacterium]